MRIRPFEPADLDAVVALSLRAWAPVFVSLREAFGEELDDALHPDWRTQQAADVEAVCMSADSVWVADVDGTVEGFVAIVLRVDGIIGEIEMLAVDPAAQVRGTGTALTEFAIDWIRERGLPVAMVGTGGDPGHAAARRTYEKAGMKLVPVARYFKRL